MVTPITFKMIDGGAAGYPIKTTKKSVLGLTHGSFHARWSGLQGTVNAVVKIQTSNVEDPQNDNDWADVTGASMTLSGATGNDMIKLNDSLNCVWIRAYYDNVGVTGGLIDIFAQAFGN